MILGSLGSWTALAEAGQVSPKDRGASQALPKPTFPCQRADREFQAGRYSQARKLYEELGESTTCAKAGVSHVQELEHACALGAADKAARRDDEALAAYKAALKLLPTAPCAIAGVGDFAPDGFSRGLKWVADALPRIPAALAALASVPLAVFILLMVLGWPKFRGKRLPLERWWPFRTLLRPRITFVTIADQDVQLDGSGAEWKVGASMIAQIKERLQRFREDALSDQSPDMDLDFGSSGERIAKLVSNETPLKNALDKVGETGETVKLLTSLLGLLYAALPIKRVSISGVLGPPVANCACATLSIESGPQLEAATTLKHPLAGAKVTSSDYMQLVDRAAVWVQFELARTLTKTSARRGPDEPDSYTRVRDGLDWHYQGEAIAARSAFEEALALYRCNWSAAIDLAITEARLEQNYARAVDVLEHAWSDLRADEGGGVRPSSRGNHYRLGYQLAAQRIHLYLSDPAKDLRPIAVEELKPLIRHATTKRRDLHKRQEASWFRREILRQHLNPAEQRLLKFLGGAVIPSAVLLLRAIELSQGEIVIHEDVLRQIPEILDAPGRTYRAVYCLACFELAFASVAIDEAVVVGHFERALEALREALCGAQDERRQELCRWARKDPALRQLSESQLSLGKVAYARRFDDLLKLYELPERP